MLPQKESTTANAERLCNVRWQMCLFRSRQVYKLEWSTEKWEELPPCYYHDSGLVVMNGELISVGGAAGNRFSLYVFTLGYPQLWINTSYPPMNTPRSSPAVLAVPGGDSALVIGGCVSTDRWTRTVEMYQVESREWSLVADLPQSLTAPSATLCAGDVVHVIGYEGIGFSCPLGALLTGSQAGVWKPLPALPVGLRPLCRHKTGNNRQIRVTSIMRA